MRITPTINDIDEVIKSEAEPCISFRDERYVGFCGSLHLIGTDSDQKEHYDLWNHHWTLVTGSHAYSIKGFLPYEFKKGNLLRCSESFCGATMIRLKLIGQNVFHIAM